jgi:hypothetical protein
LLRQHYYIRAVFFVDPTKKYVTITRETIDHDDEYVPPLGYPFDAASQR